MKKMLVGLSAVLVCAGLAFGQKPVLTVNKLALSGEVGDTITGKFRIYNTGGTASVSYVTIVSSDTNVFTVDDAAQTVSNDYHQITVTAASGLTAGNYSGTVIVTQTNAPATVLRLPVTIRVQKFDRLALGSLADARIIVDTVAWDVSSTALPPPRKYGDILIAKASLTDLSGTEHERMNFWLSKGTGVSDWENVGGQIFTTIQLAAYRRDTNATTDVTAYTPRYFGDMLVGQTGTGTSSLWIAHGTTTNDWGEIGGD